MTKENAVKGRKKTCRPTVKEYLKQRLRHIPTTVIMASFIALCLGCSVYFMVLGGDRLRDMGFSFAFITIAVLFYVFEYVLNVRVPIGFTVLFMLFMLFNYLGAVFNLYTVIPFLDDILHAAWGAVFSVLGIMTAKVLLGTPKTVKGVVGFVLFGLGFSMLTSVIWEIYEFTGDKLLPNMDLQQDTIVDYIHSFILYPDPKNPAPDGLHTWQANGIIETTIKYVGADGSIQTAVIEGGYLDVGIADTMWDLIWCFGVSAVFATVLAVDWCRGKYFYRFMIPALAGETFERANDATAEGEELSAGNAEADESAVTEPAPQENADAEQVSP